MPYAEKIVGIYKITNTKRNQCYVGQSRNIKKRIADHFNLLRGNRHPNPKLQNSFNKYGEEVFEWCIEAWCDDPDEMDEVENAFLSGEAVFAEPAYFNIAKAANTVMGYRKHTDDTRARISATKKGRSEHVTDNYRRKLSKGQYRRFMSDPKFVADLKFILENNHLSYAERGRILGIDTSSVRKKAIRYSHLEGLI